MRVARKNPQALVQQVVADAQRQLQKAAKNGALDAATTQQLPAALGQIADDFAAQTGAPVLAQDVVKALQTKLQAGLARSLARGELDAAELKGDVQSLLSSSAVGVQTLQMMNAAPALLDVKTADAHAQDALARAGADLPSQVALLGTLRRAHLAHQAENPNSPATKMLSDVVEGRTKLMRKSIDGLVTQAEQKFATGGDEMGRLELSRALFAAQDVHQAINPKSARLKQLNARADELGLKSGADAQQTRPFFARFLENQNANKPADAEMMTRKYPSDAEDGGAEDVSQLRKGAELPAKGDDVMTTKKFPSDAEDGGGVGDGGVGVGTITEKAPSDHEDGAGDAGDGGMMVTMKAPSDHEDGGDGGAGIGDIVTEKAPSDAEDGGDGGIGIGDITTEKFPSDAEDGGGGAGDDGMMVTMKAPSDHEDGGDGGIRDMVTEKAPSDAEDGGDGGIGIGDITTEKFPSDAEDGGGGAGDDGMMVTMKAPSDHEDGGDGGVGIGDVTTEKFPSDAEDGGDGGVGIGDITTEKFPSDAEDGGDGGVGIGDIATEKFPSDAEDGAGDAGDDGMMVTMKFPSDNEDGGGDDRLDDVSTEKFPSDAEDGGGGDDDGVGRAVTMKYPSDNEDAAKPEDGGNIMTTMKYPSDNEDGQ